ncbi:mobilization protein MobC [Echinicola sp. 20G]|uniref:plasmid mobilization protein n=1 Tax=Echinicola sp. 20G TaxID=2781961 RepID=UPI001910775E|nr:mobilization protein MobC [Echinicola sp. 20G]
MEERKCFNTKPYWLTVRLTQKEIMKLNSLLEKSSECRNLSELVRDMLFKHHITIKTKNASQEEVKMELALIKKELHKIGININQWVRAFHTMDDPKSKRTLALKILPLYQKVGGKLEQLFTIMAQLARSKW